MSRAFTWYQLLEARPSGLCMMIVKRKGDLIFIICIDNTSLKMRNQVLDVPNTGGNDASYDLAYIRPNDFFNVSNLLTYSGSVVNYRG